MIFTHYNLLTSMGLKEGDSVNLFYLNTKKPHEGNPFSIEKHTHSYDDKVEYLLVGRMGHTYLPQDVVDKYSYTILEEKVKRLSTTMAYVIDSIDAQYKWMVRLQDGRLALFINKPARSDSGEWVRSYERPSILERWRHSFNFVTTQDEEPVSIDELRESAREIPR